MAYGDSPQNMLHYYKKLIMGALVGHRDCRYADRVFELLERVEYRRADSEEDKRAIFKLRYEAYKRAGTVRLGSSGLFHDPLDEAPNVWIIGVYIDGDLASSLRLHISAGPGAPLPAMGAFRDIVEPHLQAGRVIIDVTRHVSKLEYSLRYSVMPYITIRPTALAQEFFDADYTVVACLLEHQAFFRRMFGCTPWSQPREYPNFRRPLAFLGYDCRAQRAATYARYPTYRSTDNERARLFWRSSTTSGDIIRAIGRQTESQFSEA